MPFIHAVPNRPKYNKYILVDLTDHPTLQKDATETAKLFKFLLIGTVSYQIVDKIPAQQTEAVLHFIGIPDSIEDGSKHLLLKTAAHLRDVALFALEQGYYLNGEIPSESNNAYISPYDLHQLIAPLGYTNSELDEFFAQQMLVAQVVQPPSVTIPAWVRLHYTDANTIRKASVNQQYLMVVANEELSFAELMRQLLAKEIDQKNCSLINQATCLEMLRANSATMAQHIIPLAEAIGLSETAKLRDIFLEMTYWFKQQEVAQVNAIKSQNSHWRASASYKNAISLSNILLTEEYPPAVFDDIMDLIFGHLLYDSGIATQSPDVKAGNPLIFDTERQKKLLAVLESIFKNFKAATIEYINQVFLDMKTSVDFIINYRATLPNLTLDVSNGPHFEWGKDGAATFRQALSNSKKHFSFVVQAGFSELYLSDCSWEKTYWPADWMDYVVHLRQQKFPVTLIKKAGRLMLYKATVNRQTQWIMTAAIEDDAAHRFATRNEAERTFDFTQVTDGFTKSELQLLWCYGGGMVEKSTAEVVNALLHCHAGRNRSPALMAILYFVCLLQQKIKQGLTIQEIIAQLGKEGQNLEDKLDTELEKLRELVGPKKYQFVNAGWTAQVKNIWKNFINHVAEFSAGDKKESIFKIEQPDEFAKKTDELLAVIQVEIDRATQALGGVGILRMFNTVPNCYKGFFDAMIKFVDLGGDAASDQQPAFARYLLLTDFKKQVRQASDIEVLDKIVDSILANKLLASEFLHMKLTALKSEQQNPTREDVQALAKNFGGFAKPTKPAGVINLDGVPSVVLSI